MVETLFIFLQILTLVIFVLVAVAYATLYERKILGGMQRRFGPDVIGVLGLLQPLADGLKLLLKENIKPNTSETFLFFFAPVLSFFISLLGWAFIPFSQFSMYTDFHIGILYILSISAMGVYGIIISGWSGNSKYGFIGALRSSAQMISYELPLGFAVILIAIVGHSLDINQIILNQRDVWNCVPFAVPCYIFFISGLAETNRHPFDLPEAESELVAGFSTEYAGMAFALFSLAEYSNILMMCGLNSILFFGGWLPLFSILGFIPGYIWFGLKVSFFYTLFVYARGILPRLRYDQLMEKCWKEFIPILLVYILIMIFRSYFYMEIYDYGFN